MLDQKYGVSVMCIAYIERVIWILGCRAFCQFCPSGNVLYAVSGNYDVQTHFKCTFFAFVMDKTVKPNSSVVHKTFIFILISIFLLFQALLYVCSGFFLNFRGLSYNVFRLFQMYMHNRCQANKYYVCEIKKKL